MFFGTNIQIYTVHEHGELDSKLVDECELILVSAESIVDRLPKLLHERVGRTVLCSLLSRPLSEAQIRNKLSILKRCGCVAVGVKKQGTTITPTGIQILQSIREKIMH